MYRRVHVTNSVKLPDLLVSPVLTVIFGNYIEILEWNATTFHITSANNSVGGLRFLFLNARDIFLEKPGTSLKFFQRHKPDTPPTNSSQITSKSCR